VDLGCGAGEDVSVVGRNNPGCRCIGIDFNSKNRETLAHRGIELLEVNIENQVLPLESETVDLIIANQVLEHIKEVYWVNHEIFRTLKVGGHFYLGVPNVLSLHNRLLGIFGVHPTCAKMISAHVRAFSKRDLRFFYKEVAQGFTAIEGFYGSQFYPFPKLLARPLATLFPSFAVTIFFLIRKIAGYRGEFLKWLSQAPMDTNYYSGLDC
jgi:SAM-dependent methyltransferase